MPEWRDGWDGGVASNTLDFSHAGHHFGAGWATDDGGHVAQLALLNQFAAAHFTAASSDNGSTAISDLVAGASNVNPIAANAQHDA